MVWGAVPFVVITLSAGLTQVPKELEEAARLDGAGAWGVFRFVTLPILKPIIVMLTTLSVIWDMGVFPQVFVMRNGHPEAEFQLLDHVLVRQGVRRQRLRNRLCDRPRHGDPAARCGRGLHAPDAQDRRGGVTSTAAAPAATRRPRKSRLGWNLLGLLVFVTAGFPVYWMLNTAFKPAKDAIDPDPHFFPMSSRRTTSAARWTSPTSGDPVGRSLIVSLVVVVIGIAVGMLAALAISRFAFRGRKIVIVGILAVQMIPLVAMIIPVFLLLNDLGQYDRLTGLIITYLTFILPFTVWTLRGFIAAVPKELEEAAMVDGCTRTGAFLRVVFPLLAPGLMATSLFGFIPAWNEYLYALMLIEPAEPDRPCGWATSRPRRHRVRRDDGGRLAVRRPDRGPLPHPPAQGAAGLTAGAVKG